MVKERPPGDNPMSASKKKIKKTQKKPIPGYNAHPMPGIPNRGQPIMTMPDVARTLAFDYHTTVTIHALFFCYTFMAGAMYGMWFAA
jgi:hypothetical protein